MSPRRHGRIGAVVAAIACACVLVACTSSDSDSSGQGEGSSSTPKTLTLLWPADATSLGTDNGLGLQVNAGIHERLAIYDALVAVTNDGELQYRLADDLTSDDQTTWTLKLKPGIEFSDGTPLDADAVKFNWEHLADPAAASPSAKTAGTIASMSVTDPTTLSITLSAPNSQFPFLVAQSALTFIGSPTAIQKDPEGFGTHPIGAGAFVLKEWIPNDHSTFERAPHSIVTTSLDSFTVKIIPDEAQRYNTIVSGGGDIDFSVDNSTVLKAESEGLDVLGISTNGGLNLQFNTQKPPFDDVRARQAIAYAVDTDALNQALFQGKSEVPTTLMRDDSPYFSDVALTAPDKNKAQSLLDELAADGKPLEFTILAPLNFKNVAEYLQSSLSSFKNVKVDIVTAPTTGQQLFAGDFDATLIGIPRFIAPYPTLTNVMSTTGSTNFGKYSNADVDADVATITATQDLETQVNALQDIQEHMVADLPFLGPLYRIPNSYILAKGLDPSVVGETLNDGVLDIPGIGS